MAGIDGQPWLCIEQVPNWHGYGTHRCKSLARYEGYCGTHSPEEKAKRKAARGPTHSEAELARRMELREAAEGALEALQVVLTRPTHLHAGYNWATMQGGLAQMGKAATRLAKALGLKVPQAPADESG